MTTDMDITKAKKLQHMSLEQTHEQPDAEVNPLMSIVPPSRTPPYTPRPQRILLDHKAKVKPSAGDWVCFVAYILSLYGFLVLMIYLLLKATKDDSQTTGIVQFSLFMVFAIVMVVFVTLWQRKQKKEEWMESRKRDSSG